MISEVIHCSATPSSSSEIAWLKGDHHYPEVLIAEPCQVD